MDNDNRNRSENVFSRKIRAGRRRTYFFDVRTTKASDYYLTITESKKKAQGDGYERHKVFIYKEDFNKFLEELTLAIDYIKERMPDFDFDAFNHRYDDEEGHDSEMNERVSDSEPDHKEAEPEKLIEPKDLSADIDSIQPKQDPTINEDDLKW